MNRTMLALMAHPDDAELCMGGTIARYAHAGFRAEIVISSLPDFPDVRRAEAAQGAAVLGAGVRILAPPSKRETWQVEDFPVYRLVAAFDAILEELQPSLVFTHWPKDTHFDHVRVSQAAFSATRRHRVDLYLCEQPNLYAATVEPMKLNTYVDVSQFMDKRLDSIACHRSQTQGKTYSEHVRARTRFHGERTGCQYAEAFCCAIQRLRID